MITHINTTATTTKEAATTKEKSRVISDVSHVYSHVISGDMNLDILPLEQARDATVSFRQRSIFSGPSEAHSYHYYVEVHWSPKVPNMKEFFKNIHSLPTGLSFKLTNQVVSFTQSANSSTL